MFDLSSDSQRTGSEGTAGGPQEAIRQKYTLPLKRNRAMKLKPQIIYRKCFL